MNDTNKLPIIKPVIQISVLIFILITSTVAWFIVTQTADLSPLGANVNNAMNVQISQNGTSWNSDITISSEALVSITELSGNGKELYVPIVQNKVISGFFLSEELPSKNNFIKFETYIKTDTSINLYLGKESGVVPLDLGTNKSTYGEYSKNYIVGATRVAFLTEDENTKELTPIYIWAPNATMQYDKSSNKVIENGVVEPYYSYAKGINPDDLTVIQTNNKSYGISEDRSFIWGNMDDFDKQEQTPPIFTIHTENKEEVVKKLTICVWIEGTDREAVLPLLGGKFKMDFKFDPVEINEMR